MTINRRHFLAAAGSAVVTGCATSAAPTAVSSVIQPLLISSTQTLMPKGNAPRVVVAGGGWGGLATARWLRHLAPQAEVVMLERNPVFFSCPLSNKWLIDAVDTQFIMHDYLRVSEQNGYRFIQCEMINIDRDTRKVYTSQGVIDYDYLVMAPGIRYNYEAWFGNDRRAADAARARFPAAYVPNAEHVTLKRALQSFKGGEWVMNLPPPPQRCPPSPYERACLIAWYFKTNKIKAKVTILDHKPRVMPIGPGFMAAFTELYKDYITYVPNAHVKEVDPFNKRIVTSAGDMKFDHAVLMAPHQAGDIAWKANAIGNNPDGKANGWAEVDSVKLHLKNDDRVYVIGDAVGIVAPKFMYYPKSGHVANRHGRIVAGYIAERLAGRTPEGKLPDNLCYMMVNGSPREAISVQFDYKLNAEGIIEQSQIDDNDRRADLVGENLKWAGHMFEDMFAGPKPL